MANRDTPMGLRVLRNANGDFPPVQKFTTGATVIYEGQLVFLRDDGKVIGVTGTYLGVTTALDILGVAQHHKAASASVSEVLVSLDLNVGQRYVVQADDATITALTDCLGANFALVNASGGVAATGQSICELDGDTGTSSAVASGSVVRVVEVSKEVGNVLAAQSWVDLVVQIMPSKLHFGHSAGVL